MFTLVFVNAAKTEVFSHFEYTIHYVIASTGTEHPSQSKLGTFKQRIIVNVINGQFKLILLFLRVEECRWILTIFFQKMANTITRTETST